MANNILDEWNSYLERLKTLSPRLYAESKCFEFLEELYYDRIVKACLACKDGEMAAVLVYPHSEQRKTSASIEFGTVAIDSVRNFTQNAGVSCKALTEVLNGSCRPFYRPVFFQWIWDAEVADEKGNFFEDQPKWTVQNVKVGNPFSWGSSFTTPSVETPRKAEKKKARTTEKDLETSLVSWLHAHGVQSDNQVSTSKHRMDVWIPGKCFLELKACKVSGDDVCQAIDYAAEYQLPVVLVGNHIGEMASRGIEAFNKAVDSEMVVFVSWSGIRTYLRGLLNL